MALRCLFLLSHRVPCMTATPPCYTLDHNTPHRPHSFGCRTCCPSASPPAASCTPGVMWMRPGGVGLLFQEEGDTARFEGVEGWAGEATGGVRTGRRDSGRPCKLRQRAGNARVGYTRGQGDAQAWHALYSRQHACRSYGCWSAHLNAQHSRHSSRGSSKMRTISFQTNMESSRFAVLATARKDAHPR